MLYILNELLRSAGLKKHFQAADFTCLAPQISKGGVLLKEHERKWKISKCIPCIWARQNVPLI